MNISVTKLKDYIREHGNPYFCQPANLKFKKFVTQIEAEKEVAQAHCSFLETTRTSFEEFRTSIFVDKTRLLSDKIVKFQLTSIDFISSEYEDMISSKDVRKEEKCQERP